MLHFMRHGPLVKRLRHRPFTAVTWVRFPYGSPNSNNPNFVITGDAFGFSVLLDWYGTAKDGRAIVDIPTYIIGMMGV